MKRALIVCAIVLAACDRDGSRHQTEAADTMDNHSSAVKFDTSYDKVQPGVLIDAGQVKVGDTVAGLQLAEKKVTGSTSRVGVSGSMSFKGELELKGRYKPHFNHPKDQSPCFWVDPADWPKVPRAQGDRRVIWFCFVNPDQAIRELGPVGPELFATIVIDQYTTNLEESDVVDSARLIRVVSKEKVN